MAQLTAAQQKELLRRRQSYAGTYTDRTISASKLYLGQENPIALKYKSHINGTQYAVLNDDQTAYDFTQDGGVFSVNFKAFNRSGGNLLAFSTSDGLTEPLVVSSNIITHREDWSDFDDSGLLKAGGHYYYELYWVTTTNSRLLELSFGRLEIE